MSQVYTHFWNGERTLSAFVEATDKAVEWFGDVNDSRFNYGLGRLIKETEEFLNSDGRLVPTECNCACAVQKRRVLENLEILRILWGENPISGQELIEICQRMPVIAKRLRIV